MEIRTEAVAGQFYPANKRELYDLIEDLEIDKNYIKNISNFVAKLKHPIRAIISPHAGLSYSGSAAKTVYYITKKSFDFYGKGLKHVILLGPNHSGFGLTSTMFKNWKTPLGVIEADNEIIKIVRKKININDRAQEYEHSLEVQLPFLQFFFSNNKFKITPIIISSDLAVNNVVAGLSMVLNYLKKKDELDRSLLVISSDFTHFGYGYGYLPFKIDEHLRENIKKLDFGAINLIKNFDVNSFAQYIKDTRTTICGYLPIYCLLRLTNKIRFIKNVEVVSYYLSGDFNKDYRLSVSYAGIVMW